MRAAVVNISGNEGKTTLSVNLLLPRMPGARIVSVETINSAGGELGAEVDQLRGEQFSRIYAELAAADDLVLDVGASNFEPFFNGLQQFEDGHDEIDLFVIPVTPSRKERTDAMKTAAILADLGVCGKKVAFVFNRTSDVAEDFADVLRFAEKTGTARAHLEAFVPESDLFSLLAEKKINIAQALSDETDWKAQLKAASRSGDKKAFDKAADMVAIQKMSRAMDRQLQHVFNLLIAGIEG
ncbi:TPA: hypothetical protein NIA45_006746 [Pseudomonas aeruginosa]|nr:hypothetical protein [Pseudomonas aeruginosa]